MYNILKMKIAVLIILLFAFCGKEMAATQSKVTESKVDYLMDFKQQLTLVWPKNKTMNVVFHGHSVPSGYFSTPTVNTLAAYPHLFLVYLKEKYPTAVINCITTAIGGENSEQGEKRFANDVLCLKPDLLFIDYGLNDRGISLERAEKAWRSMVEQALEKNIKIVLFTPTPDLKEDILDGEAPLVKYVEMIKKLGTEYQIPVVDSYDSFKVIKQSGIDLVKYMAQNNHPNELGHQVVLNEMVKTLFPEMK